MGGGFSCLLKPPPAPPPPRHNKKIRKTFFKGGEIFNMENWYFLNLRYMNKSIFGNFCFIHRVHAKKKLLGPFPWLSSSNPAGSPARPPSV